MILKLCEAYGITMMARPLQYLDSANEFLRRTLSPRPDVPACSFCLEPGAEESYPKRLSTNIMRTLGFYIGDHEYGLGQVIIISVLGPSGLQTRMSGISVFPLTWEVSKRKPKK